MRYRTFPKWENSSNVMMMMMMMMMMMIPSTFRVLILHHGHFHMLGHPLHHGHMPMRRDRHVHHVVHVLQCGHLH